MPLLRLTRYRTLKDRLLGLRGSAGREQFERELAQELKALAQRQKPYTRKPRE